MKLDDLVLLIKAGYTKADIEQLGIAGVPEVPEVPEQPVKQPVEEPAQQNDVPQDNERMKNLESKLDYVINRFNYMAVQQSNQPGGQQEESLDDILSSVVRGFRQEDKP